MNKLLATAFLCLLGCAGVHPPGRATTPEPSTGAKLFNAGLEFARQGDPVRAEQYLSLATERGVPSSRTYPHLVRAALRRSGYGAALNYTRRHLLVAPGDSRARRILSSLQTALTRTAQFTLSRHDTPVPTRQVPRSRKGPSHDPS